MPFICCLWAQNDNKHGTFCYIHQSYQIFHCIIHYEKYLNLAKFFHLWHTLDDWLHYFSPFFFDHPVYQIIIKPPQFWCQFLYEIFLTKCNNHLFTSFCKLTHSLTYTFSNTPILYASKNGFSFTVDMNKELCYIIFWLFSFHINLWTFMRADCLPHK